MSEFATVGPWAKEKLGALARYLDFYTKVLKNQRWRTVYVDAFAGGGRAIVRPDDKHLSVGPTLFPDDEEIDAGQRELIDGSPRVALNVANPFSRYIFIDPDNSRCVELEALKREYAESRTVDVLRTSAAEGIEWLTAQRILKSTHRGIVFLDPFGAGLEWSIINKLAGAGLFEVVVNLPLGMAIQRMLPNSGRVPEAWTKTLDAYFGTHNWFDLVYCKRQSSLFEIGGLEKNPDYSERLLQLYRARLKAAFGHVSAPRLIRNTRGAPLYHLLWAGPHSKGLEGANHVLQMGEPVGRQEQRAKQT